MKYQRWVGGSAVALAIWGAVASSQAATLYDPSVNILDAVYGTGAGSFELGTFPEGGGAFARLSAGSAQLTGWTVGGNGVDWLAAPHAAADGAMSVDLAAQTGGWIETLIPTIPGNIFTIEFDAYGGQRANTGTMQFGSFAAELFSAPAVVDASVATFQHFIYTYIADSESAVLRFSAASSDGFGPVIDNVVVKDPPPTNDTGANVPEPATFGLASCLALCFGAALIRRK